MNSSIGVFINKLDSSCTSSLIILFVQKLDVDLNVVKEERDVAEDDTVTCQNDEDGDRMYMKVLPFAFSF